MKTVTVLKFHLFFCGVFWLFSTVSSTNDYCDPKLCYRARHIACHNSGSFANICSADARVITITKSLKAAIVEKHNSLRNKIAKGGFSGFPAAARMATMKWNSELAQIASLNVKQCEMLHDECRNTGAFRYAGQNLAVTAWYGQILQINDVALKQIASWFDEYQDATNADIYNFGHSSSGAVIGHFTQMIQEKATHVGCAILKQTNDDFIEQYMACNYAYGNILSRPVYHSASRAASKCETGVNPIYEYLCSTNERYNVNS